MIPSVFFVVAVFFSGSNIVRCDVISLVSCNETTLCTTNVNSTVCYDGFCHTQAGRNCTMPTTTTATTVSSAATTTAPSISVATTTVAATSPAITVAPNTTATGPSGRRKRSADQQQCVPNASCELNEQTILMCRCNTGYSEDQGLCTKNVADYLRGAALSVTLVTTVMLYLI
ncbi:uncharacterized protein LOC127881045 [Dreissena polymorpha]|uniref:EGF-like domain-containing protein n=1 Tax=Dreissena polymorpha TaxID=45954 RepID=A0A9D4GMS1_DREPO|nr:uncharacterized protein LOC127881045 [Dreissena polymorpha]KAH3820276.1 hypothetical protein DPMN_122022 [Dreissena polymorpha]